MRAAYILWMHRLYFLCIVICVVAIVAMTGLIFTGVVMRYFFNLGAQFAEPCSIFFSIQLTFYGAAACFRANAHLRLQLFVNMLPEAQRRMAAYLADALMACVAVFMIVYGASLVQTTFFQTYPEFQYVRVGLVYTAIPLGGLVLLLFVIEAAFFGSGGQTTWAKISKEADEAVREARSTVRG